MPFCGGCGPRYATAADQHGTPFRLLVCEFEAVGYRLVAFSEKKDVGAYFARFTRQPKRPEPEAMTACKNG